MWPMDQILGKPTRKGKVEVKETERKPEGNNRNDQESDKKTLS